VDKLEDKMKHVNKTLIIAEIGINFAFGKSQADFMDNVKKLIDAAVAAGCDYVKFQKRNPEDCIPKAEWNKAKQVPWRAEETTYLQYKKDIELWDSEFDQIDEYCREKGILWFASVWDKASIDFMRQYHTKLPNGKIGVMIKIPSALINDLDLVLYAKESSDFLLISTGMSTQREIDDAISVGEPDVVFHTNSTYPSPVEELNLDYITYLQHIRCEFIKAYTVGYSGHEFGLSTTVAANMLGAEWIERHLTLDRTLWGSDQMASVEPAGMVKLVKSIRDIECARGGYGARKVLASEKAKRKTLRGK
jgi:N-acetylneuraminate synthase